MFKKLKRFLRRQQFIKLAQRKQTVMLDLGSGGPGRYGALGVDLNPAADVIWDLGDPIPLSDHSVEKIFSDHFFEHLDPLLMLQVLKDCRRLLKANGKLRFTVPHLDPYLALYAAKDAKKLKDLIYDVPDEYEEIFNTSWGRISWLLLRNGEHKGIYDAETIIHIVKLAGFKHVRETVIDPKIDINIRYSSVYVEAWN